MPLPVKLSRSPSMHEPMLSLSLNNAGANAEHAGANARHVDMSLSMLVLDWNQARFGSHWHPSTTKQRKTTCFQAF